MDNNLHLFIIWDQSRNKSEEIIIENDDDDILEVGESIELLAILSNHPDWGYAENVVGVLEVVERKSLNCFLLFGKPIAVNQSCNSR